MNPARTRRVAGPPRPTSAGAWTMSVRQLADQAFSRAAGAPLVTGNRVRVLRDARENYPAWLDAIAAAKRFIHFESYIIHDDAVGEEFARVLITRARDGIRVRLIYDWLGGLGKTRQRFWRALREGGVEVRCYNPPHPASPLGWLSRDHRKMLCVDGTVAFVTGLCVGKAWVGDPERGVAPWRDTGIEVRGPAVAHIERAFEAVWAAIGEPLSVDDAGLPEADKPQGDAAVRVVATVPNTGGVFRVDLLLAALARRRLWLTDAYYAATSSYVEALRAAARDGVDVRLLVPGGTDIPLLRPLSRAGYRALLEAGVRVFEWNGSMLHAKTAVADGRWARVGSSNLNIASWLGNLELDVVVEDEAFAQEMERMYLDDLGNATEVVLDARRRIRAPGAHGARPAAHGGGSAGLATAGLLRIGNTVGAAMGERRVLEPVEGRIMLIAGAVLLGLALLIAVFPRAFAYAMAVPVAWVALTLLYRGVRLSRQSRHEIDSHDSHE